MGVWNAHGLHSLLLTWTLVPFKQAAFTVGLLTHIHIVISSLGGFAKVFSTDVKLQASMGLFGMMRPTETVKTACMKQSMWKGRQRPTCAWTKTTADLTEHNSRSCCTVDHQWLPWRTWGNNVRAACPRPSEIPLLSGWETPTSSIMPK